METGNRIFSLENFRRLSRAVLLGGTMAVAACGGGDNTSATTAPARTETTAPSASSTGSVTEGVSLVFDDLGANSSIIRVYPGVEDTPEDRIANGTFNDGDSVPAECKTLGREVKSVPPEPLVTSNEWYRIHGTPGEIQFASATYTENADELHAQLPDC